MKIILNKPLYIQHQGKRPNQEDSLWPLPENAEKPSRLFMVCDGMGGHEKGEVASSTVCGALGEWIEHNVRDGIFTKEHMKAALAYAYEKLDEEDGGEFKRMGTTLTLLYFGRNGVTAAYIGDSRIYHIRPKEGVLFQSCDHSLVYDLYRSGEITYEQMATHPQKNVIQKAITTGKENRVEASVCRITNVQAGDWFYLCSDGMLEQMSNDELAQILTGEGSAEEKRERLYDETIENHDNHTAWMIQVARVEKNEPGDDMLELEDE